MVLDINWESYFTPNYTVYPVETIDWYQPWHIANFVNLTGANDTLPKTYQYVPGQTWADRSKDLIVYAEVVKTLRFGSTAQLIIDTPSDRDVFEISDNEKLNEAYPYNHIGVMLPRMKFPYRVHRINLQTKDDVSMPTGMFVGGLIDYSIQSMSDIKNDNQDGRWRIELNFVSFDHPRGLLGRNRGAPLWHHRANNTTDNYHIIFRSSDALSFDSAITQIVAWMNTSRPTTDFPVTFSYTQKATDPYTRTIGSNPMEIPGTVTFTNGDATVTGAGVDFNDALEIEQKIKRTVDGNDKWGYVSSIAADGLSLELSSVYTGTTGTVGHKIPVDDVVTVDGRSTWEVLEKLLAYMGAVEALGNKYIPTCSTTGVIDVTQGGYEQAGALTGTITFTNASTAVSGVDSLFTTELVAGQKICLSADGVWVYVSSVTNNTNLVLTYNYPGVGGAGSASRVPVDEDFRSNYGAQNNVAFTPNIKFNLVRVPFTKINNAEYWIKFTLKKGADIILNIPSSGYEYVPYDAKNIHSSRYYKVPTQDANTEYTWIVDLVTAGNFAIATTGGYVLSPQTYQFLNSPLRIDYSKINSFLVTRGSCYDGYGGYATAVAAGKSPQGCMDGGLLTDSGYEKCTDIGAWGGCYPDPDATPTESVNAIYGIQGTYAKVNTLSALNSWDTVCRKHSKKLYQCQLNADSLVREPINGTIIFNDGYTGNLVGSYVEVYSPEMDAMVIMRVIEQKHIMAQGRMPTILKVFRV